VLTREHILSRKPKRHVVSVPEWDGEVTIQALTVGTAQEITPEQGLVDLVIASVINDDGSPMFSPEDKPQLLRQSFAACKRLAEAVIEFNGLSKAAVEDAVKNSGPGLNGSSSTASA
jgi:hypothetical protein